MTEEYVPPLPPNNPPSLPYDPYPENGAMNVSVITTLSWKCDDIDGDALTYKVYLKINEDWNVVYEGMDNFVNVSLSYGEEYEWKVIASDGKESVESNVWHFVTEEESKIDTNGWTIMIYLDGDNNMESYAQLELDEIRSVKISGNMTVTVLYDGRGNHNSHFYIMTNESYKEISLNEIYSRWSDEVNMGSSTTLSEFINYSMGNYPAENYMLELWNHGNGWMGICWDEMSGDRLTMGEIKNALSDVYEEYGRGMDILVYTACRMAEIECMYEVMGYVKYFIASEESVLATGLPHEDILEDIVTNDSINPRDLCIKIVEECASYYQYTQTATISAWDIELLSNLSNAINTLSQILISEATDHAQIENVYYNTESFGGIGIVDLYDFAFNIQKNFLNNTYVYNAAQTVMENVTKVVFAEWHGEDHQNAHGISIYFPLEENYVNSYENTDFAINTHWDEFLEIFYGI